MHWTTLISAEELASAIDRCIVVDCRHDLADPSAGERAYAEGHIPSAFFLHLDRDLSGPKRVGAGRHPLPDRESFRCRLEALGLSDRTQLVVYDAQGGAMAVRVWALARWLGHEAVAVLDGDLRAWSAAGYPVTADPPAAPARRGRLDPGRPHLLAMVDADAIVGDLNAPAASRSMTIVDARAPERFSGAVEPIDLIAGHIPGAINRPFAANLRPDGRFKPAAVLRDEFAVAFPAELGRTPGARGAGVMVHQCGSGVTACHNLLAMEHAGLAGSRLYPGSWSDWITDPSRPIARDA